MKTVAWFYSGVFILAMILLPVLHSASTKADDGEDDIVWTEIDVPGDGYGQFKYACIDNRMIYVTKKGGTVSTNGIAVAFGGDPKWEFCS